MRSIRISTDIPQALRWGRLRTASISELLSSLLPRLFTRNFLKGGSLVAYSTWFPMNIVRHIRRLFYIGSARTPAGRALLIEQFRILTSQIPVLYGVLIVDS